jgi:hypothetical protein
MTGVTLTHNMMRISGKLTADGLPKWRCVDCGRAGTIAEINSKKCPDSHEGGQSLIDAIEGKGKFSK